MSENSKIMDPNWTDPDDAPELDEHFFRHGQITHGDVVIREATDTMARRGRPPKGERPKVNQTLRLSPDVLAHFRASGDGWQARIDEALRAAMTATRL